MRKFSVLAAFALLMVLVALPAMAQIGAEQLPASDPIPGTAGLAGGTAGIIGGSTIFQSLWNSYIAQVQQVTAQALGQIIQVMSAVVISCIQLAVIIWGVNALYGHMSMAETVRRSVTCIIVASLMSTAFMQEYIVQNLTVTIPGMITQMTAGGAVAPGTGSAQGWDGLCNAITNLEAKLSAQMIGIWYVGDRCALFIACMVAKIFLAFAFVIWAIAALLIWFMVLLVPIIAPTFLFRATASIGHRVIAKILALLLVMLLTMLTGSLMVRETGAWFQASTTQLVQAQQPNPGFQMNSGATQEVVGNPDVPGGYNVPAGQGVPTLNTVAGMSDVVGLIISLVFGWFLLLTSTVIAATIAGAGPGFSATAIINVIGDAAIGGVGLVTRGAKAGRAVGRAAR